MIVGHQIIQGKWDSDTYAWTMANAQQLNDQSHGRNLWLHYKLIHRNKWGFPPNMVDVFREQVQNMTTLATPAHQTAHFKARATWVRPSFIDWFANEFRFNPNQVTIGSDSGRLSADIIGPVPDVMFWQFPIMQTTNELDNILSGRKPKPGWERRTSNKGILWKKHGVPVAEFGSRRRFSYAVQKRALEILIETMGLKENGGLLLGTSNGALAGDVFAQPMGTKGHDRKQIYAALVGYLLANKVERAEWLEAYPEFPGYDLPDTFTTKVYLRDWDDRTILAFTGMRQDSGDPYWFTDAFVNFYRYWRVPFNNKGMIYSNKLDSLTAVQLVEYNRKNNLFTASCGIGTNITNDVGWPAPDYVVKLWAVSLDAGKTWISVCKLSDDDGKVTGAPDAVARAKRELGIG